MWQLMTNRRMSRQDDIHAMGGGGRYNTYFSDVACYVVIV